MHAADFARMLPASSAATHDLAKALLRQTPHDELTRHLRLVRDSCKSCHTAYRDDPVDCRTTPDKESPHKPVDTGRRTRGAVTVHGRNAAGCAETTLLLTRRPESHFDVSCFGNPAHHGGPSPRCPRARKRRAANSSPHAAHIYLRTPPGTRGDPRDPVSILTLISSADRIRHPSAAGHRFRCPLRRGACRRCRSSRRC